jgi:dipeptidyl-peptidase 4
MILQTWSTDSPCCCYRVRRPSQLTPASDKRHANGAVPPKSTAAQNSLADLDEADAGVSPTPLAQTHTDSIDRRTQTSPHHVCMRKSLYGLVCNKQRDSMTSSPPISTKSAPLHVHLTAEAVASLPPPGLSGPTSLAFSPAHSTRYLAFVSSTAAVIRTTKSPPALYRPLTGEIVPQPITTSTASCSERVLMCVDLTDDKSKIESPQPLLSFMRSSSKRRILDADNNSSEPSLSLEERLRRERQRLSASSGSLTQFSWVWWAPSPQVPKDIRVLIPARGSLFVQDGWQNPTVKCIYDKQNNQAGAVDPQLSPDGLLVAWTSDGEVLVQSAQATKSRPIQVTFGAVQSDAVCISHGVADFVAQEEMDRYRGFWWHPDSNGILLARVDESKVPIFRIMHQDTDQIVDAGSTSYEDHRYPFAGKHNPSVTMVFVPIDRESILLQGNCESDAGETSSASDSRHGSDYRDDSDPMEATLNYEDAQMIAQDIWKNQCRWFEPPREASEYLARVHWLPDKTAAAQWQNRSQTVSIITRLDVLRGKSRTLLVERSDVWINLHHMFKVLPRPVHPQECAKTERNIPPMPYPLPTGSFSFLFASERTGFAHLYLYTFVPGINGEQAVLLRTVTSGEWMVENIVGVDMQKDLVYFTGTYDSVLEKHLYALPLTNRRSVEDDDYSDDGHGSNGVRRSLNKVMSAFAGKSTRTKSADGIWSTLRPVRLTVGSGMHSVVMDEACEVFADTSSDLDRPTSVKIYRVPDDIEKFAAGDIRQSVRLLYTLYNAAQDDRSLVDLMTSVPTNGNGSSDSSKFFLPSLPPPELMSFPTSDGTEVLHATVYRPDGRIYGPGPYPLVCAVYGGPHVQRVNRSWSQCADMRAQRLRSLGFCVVKCDNRGSSRRGLAFESSIARRLGRLEVLDQVAAVRQLTMRGIVDPNRVGVYGWSYGGYLAAMCLCRAPDVFQAAVAGAPVTSWDGYDTHYTERYMGLPSDNPAGYRESAVFDHVANMRGKLMIVHGLIDENVHFRHTARLINKIISSGKDYDLLIFPDERHSPRRLRDRIYMEQRISDFLVKSLSETQAPTEYIHPARQGGQSIQTFRNLAGHL